MQTIETLIEKITPLPWHIDQHGNVQTDQSRRLYKVCLTGFALGDGSQAEANNAYVHHAATHFPKLLEALERIVSVGYPSGELVEIAEEALTQAREVKG